MATPKARARRTDPVTSHEAAASVDLQKREQETLKIWKRVGRKRPLTSYEAYELGCKNKMTQMPDSGFRTRTKTLVLKGLLVIVDRDGRTGSNRAAMRYQCAK